MVSASGAAVPFATVRVSAGGDGSAELEIREAYCDEHGGFTLDGVLCRV